MTDTPRDDRTSRRAFLTGAVGAAAAIAGCAGRSKPGQSTTDRSIDVGSDSRQGTSTGRRSPVTLESLSPLEGELTIYLGRGEGGLYADIVDFLETRYADFTVTLKRGPSASLANTIITEEKYDNSPADVFWSIDAASLGIVAQKGLAAPLPKSITRVVPAQFRDNARRWLGISGRARAIPYNTDEISADQVPESVFGLPERERFDGALGWAPSYGSFQAFVTAMRLLRGEERTRAWLTAMQESGVTSYPGEFGVTYDVAQGTLTAGLANHYYALRLKEANPEAPLDLAFTSGGPGALINVAGALVLKSSDRKQLATNFVHHLLAQELQEFLVETAFAYPMAPGVPPPSGNEIDLPPLEELQPPDIDLTKLADLQPTLELLRETGVL
ncbi:MAG: iron ABC transporter substrate-binding protein [Halodesulfurarchaeum sp.]